MYITICIYTHYIHIHIYIYIYRERERDRYIAARHGVQHEAQRVDVGRGLRRQELVCDDLAWFVDCHEYYMRATST